VPYTSFWDIDLTGEVRTENEKMCTLNSIIGHNGTVWIQLTFHNLLGRPLNVTNVYQLTKRASGTIVWSGQDLQRENVYFHRYESVLRPIENYNN
jgi:hypothetical protein